MICIGCVASKITRTKQKIRKEKNQIHRIWTVGKDPKKGQKPLHFEISLRVLYGCQHEINIQKSTAVSKHKQQTENVTKKLRFSEMNIPRYIKSF